MTTNSWKNAVNGDWTTAADWSSGAAPTSSDIVTMAAPGAYTVTLYTAGVAAGLTLNDAGLLFYDSGTLTVSGTIALQAGTLSLAYGALQGGTLALSGGLLQSAGGTLNGVCVQGLLDLSPVYSTLYVQNGLTLQGAGGTGSGTVALTGSNATLDFLGSQTLANASVALGAAGGGVATLGVSHLYGASAGATLILAPSLWISQTTGQGVLAIGGATAGPPVSDALVNQGTITASGGTLTVSGAGTFVNQGSIGISGGATLDIASTGFSNTGVVAVSNATLDFGGSFATSLLSNLGSLALSQAVVEIGGTDVNTGTTLTIGAGSALGPVTLAGTITGGTVVDAGGGLVFGPGTGVLAGVGYQGTLALTTADAAVTLSNNTTLYTSNPGSAVVTGAGAALLLQGQDLLGFATIALGSNISAAELGTTDSWAASTATTATLGARLTVQQAGLYAALDANAQTPIPGIGLSDTMVSYAQISGAIAGGTLTIGGYGSFVNIGSISVSNGDSLLVTAASFSNTGTIAISGGATAVLGGPANLWGNAPAWSNTGTIQVTGGTLLLAGTVRTAQLGSITSTAGSIGLTGTLANAGDTLSLGSGGTLPALSLTGTIQGGAIADPTGMLSIGAGGTALLQGVSYAGTLSLLQQSAYLRIYQGLALSGTATVTGAGSVLAFQGTQGFNNATVNLGAAGSAAALDVVHDSSAAGGSTLTLGRNLQISQAGLYADIGLAGDRTGDGIVNNGAITGAIAGGTLILGGAAFSNQGALSVSNGDTLALAAAIFSNTGTITVTNAGLSIGGSMATAALGSLVLTNPAMSVTGTLNNAGNTLTIGTGSAWGRLTLSGTLHGGLIYDDGLGLNAVGNATLDNVSYRGTLNLSRPFQDLEIADGFHLNDFSGTQTGTMFLTGAACRVVATTTETLPNTALFIGSNSVSYYGQRIAAPELDAGPGTTLTVGLSTTIRSAGTYSTLGNAALGQWTDNIVNDGTVLSATTGCTMTLDSSFFLNAASLLIGNGSSVMIADVGFSNTGVISVAFGANLLLSLYNYYAAPDAGTVQATNAGTIRILGGQIGELTGGGTFPSVPVQNLAGGLIQGLGTILAPVLNNGIVESKYGPVLALQQGVTGTGTLLIDQAVALELNNAVAASQTVSFAGTTGTLKLDMPLSFGAKVVGFGGGDILDFPNTPVSAVSISNGTLAARIASGTFFLNTPTPLAGAVAVSADGHGGSDIAYTPQPGGSGIGTIAVSSPNMLFWAAPAGDVFAGPVLDLNNMRIGNWTSADSLDFTDMAGAHASASYTQGTGQGTLTVLDGSKTAHVILLGTYSASHFQSALDVHGGALVTYTHG